MEIIKDPKIMQQRSAELKKSGKKIVFVPTMGGLHEGHLSLVREGKKHGDITVMSLYLNPTQFGPNEDLSSYPADLEKDLEAAKRVGVDFVFCPCDKDIYPKNFQTFVETAGIAKSLCGASRPEHFRGVTTVVLKLFNIVKPDVAIFGQKDYQQLKVIQRMVKDLNLDIKIVGAPIVREEDGLAMSSRNAYLSLNERIAARSISASLKAAAERVMSGEKNPKRIIEDVRTQIESNGIGKVDYVKICHPETLEEIERLESPAILAVAAYFGKARLIDNCILMCNFLNNSVPDTD